MGTQQRLISNHFGTFSVIIWHISIDYASVISVETPLTIYHSIHIPVHHKSIRLGRIGGV